MERFIYQVSDEDPTEFAELVIALNEEEAVDIVWKDGRYCGEKENLEVIEMDDSTKVFLLRDKSYIVQDIGILREFDFQLEGDMRCECCGLAEMDGKYPVCPECVMCEECGHEDGCSNYGKK